MTNLSLVSQTTLPADWTVVALGDLLAKLMDFRGRTPKKLGMDWGGGTIPALSANNVRMGFVDFKRECYLGSEELYRAWMVQGDVERHDLVFTMEAPLGNVAVILDDRKYILSQRVVLLRPNPKVQFQYLFQYLRGDAFAALLDSNSTGSTAKGIQQKRLVQLPVVVPPIAEQKKIAEILTAVDDKLDVIARQIEATQTLKRGLMHLLFSRGVGTQDANGRWVPRTEFKGSVLGDIPAEWQVVQIQAVSEVIRGASPRPQGDPRYYGGGVPRLMGADVTRDGKWVTPKIDFLTEEGAKRSRPCPKGTLTIICSGDVGVPSFLAVDACIHDGFLALINIDESQANKDYLYHIIYSVKQRFYTSATHGGVFTNLTTGILKEFLVPLPTLVEQQKIASILDVADEKISAVLRKREYYQSLKRGLMQKLLIGEWRVKLYNDTSNA